MLDFSAALSGVQCSMEQSFRDNELISSAENLSWLIKGVEWWTTLEEILCPTSMQIWILRFDWNGYGVFHKNFVSILRVVPLFASDVQMQMYYFILR